MKKEFKEYEEYKEEEPESRSQETLGYAEAVSRATPGSGSSMLNLTRGECCLPWKKASQLRHMPAATLPGSSSSYSLTSSYSFFFSRPPSTN
jgi:hypothetical protein